MKQHICTIILLMGLVGTIPPPIANAQDTYRFEAGAALSFGKSDNQNTLMFGLGGIYYLLPVETAGHPLNEADFLERIGSIAMVVAAGSTDVENDYYDFTQDSKNFGLEAIYAMPNQPLSAQISYFYSDSEFDDHLFLDGQSQYALTLGLGAFLMDGLRASLNYIYKDGSYDTDLPMVDDWSANGFGAEVKWVTLLVNKQAINLVGSAEWQKYSGEYEGNTSEYALEGDFYFTPNLSFGLLISLQDGDEEENESKTYGIRSRYFFHPRFSLFAEYSRYVPEVDADSDSSDTFDLELTARF